MVRETMRSQAHVGVGGFVASDAAAGSAAREATMRWPPIELVDVVAPTLVSSTKQLVASGHVINSLEPEAPSEESGHDNPEHR